MTTSALSSAPATLAKIALVKRPSQPPPSGIRVLDLTDERGHLAGKILGELGADVIKIEPPGGDPLRTRGPFVGGEVHPEASIPWLAANTSKRGIVLDLAELAGRADFLELVTVSAVSSKRSATRAPWRFATSSRNAGNV